MCVNLRARDGGLFRWPASIGELGLRALLASWQVAVPPARTPRHTLQPWTHTSWFPIEQVALYNSSR